VARYAPAALVAALLVATALAFAHTESLKLTRSPIFKTQISKTFSPVCRCATGTAEIRFRLRRADRVDVEIVDQRREVVRTLAEDRAKQRGTVRFAWDGRDDAGAVVPEGLYRPRIGLDRQRRTILLPNPIRVDVTAPVIEAFTARPRVFSPDGDLRADRVVVRYRVDEPARVSLYVDRVRAVRKKGRKQEGTIDWFGKVSGARLDSGTYHLTLGVEDIAGNVRRASPSRPVVVRFVALGRDRIETPAGARFAVLVLSDAARVTWRLGARRGTARPGTLRLRAPAQPGRFTLTIAANEHKARAAVIVREQAP
jgi:hypothetical protein